MSVVAAKAAEAHVRFFRAAADWRKWLELPVSWWVIRAKRAESLRKRFAQPAEDSAAGRRIGPLRRTPAT